MKLVSVQILRFVAAAMVVHLHAVERVAEATGGAGVLGQAGAIFGRAGVDVFFVISGFIITLTGRRLGTADFLARRARRILPLYCVLALVWLAKEAVVRGLGWRDVLATMFLWPATDRMTVPLVPVAWTLCFEMLFYLGFALLLWRQAAFWLLLPAFLAALAIREGAILQFIGNPIILEFLGGAALVFVPVRRWMAAGLPLGFGWLVLGAVRNWPPHGTELGFLEGTQGWLRLATLGVPAMLIVLGALAVNAREGGLSRMGDASYSLYLTHAPIVSGVVVLLLRFSALPADLVILAAMVASVVVAWRVHVLFERPVMDWFGRRALEGNTNAIG